MVETGLIILASLILWIPQISYGASLEEVVKILERLPKEVRLEKIIEGARQEKELLIYTSTQAEETQKRVEFFKRKYPFIVEAKFYRSSHHKLLTRMMMEYRAKRYYADVVNINGDIIYLAKKEGLVGGYFPLESGAFPKGFKDSGGYWTALNIRPYVLEYNTRLVIPEDLPRKLGDLLNEKWRGRLALDDREYTWFANLLKVFGEKDGIEFMKRLARQDISLRSGHTLLSQLVAAGEFPINVVQYAHVTERSKRSGAPVDWVGMDPIITDFNSIALTRYPLHPYSAMLFIEYMLSEEGQKLLIRDRGLIPARSNIEPDPPLTKGLELVPVDLQLMDGIQRHTQLFQQIFLRK